MCSATRYVVTLPRTQDPEREAPRRRSQQRSRGVGTFDAFKDPTTGKSIIIDRCGSAVVPWA
jgi:hypothetical protein